MRALLLAGGMGSRLQPLTSRVPKCLVPIYGRPLLDYWLESLVSAGIHEILINTHYLAPMVEDYLSECQWSDYVTPVNEQHLLGTGGTILKNRDFFKHETFFVAHADNLTLFDFHAFAVCHASRPSQAIMTMMLFNTDAPQSCGIVELDEQGVVVAFHEKKSDPPGNLANAAVYVFEPSMIELLSSLGQTEIDISTQVIPLLMGKIKSYLNQGYHRDIGTIESWSKANREFPVSAPTDENFARWSSVYGAVGSVMYEEIAGLLKNV